MGNVIALEREILTDISSASGLFAPLGERICDVLEDKDRDLNMDGFLEEGKIYGETAIPYGFYPIVRRFSPHFQKEMFYIENVKTHKDVMFHQGNKPADSLGCPLIGKRVDEFSISKSRATYKDIFLPLMTHLLAQEKEMFLQVIKSRNIVDKRSKQ